VADINEKVNVETSGAVDDLGTLEQASKDADTALDKLQDQAKKTDQEQVTVPVETPGAKQAATELDAVDESARKAGTGAQVGTQHVSDLAGAFGPAGGAASTFGQAIEGAGGIVESFAGQLGLSEEAAGKLTAGIGLLAVGVAAAAAAWQVYNQDAEKAKKGLDETRDALGQVYDKLREGDQQAAAQTFVDTMGDKIKKFQDLIGHGVTQADIAGVIFGDPASIDKVEQAVGKLDGTTRVLAENGVKLLQGSWDDAKASMQANIDLESKVAGFFGATETAARDAATAIDGYKRSADLAAQVPQGSTAQTSQMIPTADALRKMFGPNANINPGQTVYNVFPPANTPLAVEQAGQRYTQINGPG
jgi:hypothetical protein